MVQSDNRMESDMAEKRTEEGMRKKIEYNIAYNKENTIRIVCNLNCKHDAELIETWKNLPNKSAWIKEKLREELEKQKAGQ